jgi:uncharacterized membrane protein
MIKEILWTFLITLVPGIELRGSLPYALYAAKLGWFWSLALSITANILVAFVVWFIVKYVMEFLCRFKQIDRVYQRFVAHSQKKLKPSIDKYGILGVAVFIGIPLPGTGVYTAGVGAYFLGMKFKDFFKASILGVLIAAVLVSVVLLTGNTTLNIFIKAI